MQPEAGRIRARRNPVQITTLPGKESKLNAAPPGSAGLSAQCADHAISDLILVEAQTVNSVIGLLAKKDTSNHGWVHTRWRLKSSYPATYDSQPRSHACGGP